MMDEENNTQTKNSTSKELYKKWVRSSSGSGRFCKLELWSNKIIVDMGTTDNDGKLNNNTKLYTDVVELYTYLEAVKLGTAVSIYPSDHPDKDKAAFDQFVSYGGGKLEGKDVSRILKIQAEEGTRQSYLWKNGIFEARQTAQSSGAFIPDYSKQVSVSSIKMTRQEMAIIANTILMDGRFG